jgi:hypothetical protein
MSQAIQANATFPTAIDTARRSCPTDQPSLTGRAAVVPSQAEFRSELHTIPEAIVGGLVKQYFHCSTTMSGIFRCW